MADILDFAENLEGEEDLKLETSKIYDKIDKDEEIEDIQPKLEEPKKATPIILGKKFTKSTLVLAMTQHQILVIMMKYLT